MDYKKDLHELIDAIEQEHVIRFLRSLVQHLTDDKDGTSIAENLMRLFSTE